MKKIIVLLMALTLLFTVGCGGEKSFPDNLSCEDIVAAYQSAGEKPEYEKFYRKSENNLDAFSMSLWADGSFQECDELELLEDYAIYLGSGADTYEVTVLKAKNEADTEKLIDLIKRRKKTLENGDKGMYDQSFETKMANSVVKTDGKFVIFLITDDNDAAIKAAEKLKE
ncbi:MAG: DUF4358 domain-containing protein [Ruminococcaceae bacterium]|nr:DUF4358 domain-containing protein [Oscillospiraceae bacterium]